jgi:DNA-binding MarR family transcriptional regulator
MEVSGPKSNRRPTPAGVPALVLRLGTEIRTAFDRRLAPFGLTMQQAGLLLHCTDPIPPAQVAPVLGTDTAGLTRLADHLEARGLLRRLRNPDDRRSILLEPTPAGVAIIPELRRIFRETVRDLMGGFSAPESAELLALLERLAANAHEVGDRAAVAGGRPKGTRP